SASASGSPVETISAMAAIFASLSPARRFTSAGSTAASAVPAMRSMKTARARYIVIGPAFAGPSPVGFLSCVVERQLAVRSHDRLLPHVDADVGGLHRIIGERLVLVAGEPLRLRVGGPLFRELVVGRVLHRHEVVPCGEVADQRLGIDAAQLFFADGESHDRN